VFGEAKDGTPFLSTTVELGERKQRSSGGAATDDDIIRKVVANPTYQSLWNGDFSAYGSQSEADLALVGRIGFFASGDTGRTDGIFRQSGLMRNKWSESHYGPPTLAKALGSINQFCDCDRRHISPRFSDNSPNGAMVIGWIREGDWSDGVDLLSSIH
jgi:primase-polymerase (primpol)-like protein